MTLIATKKRNRLFPELLEDFFNERFFDNSPFFALSKTNGSLVPGANITEDPENFTIELAAPGLKRDDFKVEVKNGVLNVSSENEEEKEEEGKNFMRREFSYSSFSRSFALPDNLLEDKIDAKYENGILKLTLPKKEAGHAETAKQIKVG